MEAIQEPLVKKGWQRAMIYLVGGALVTFFVSLFGVFLINEAGLLPKNADSSTINFSLVYVLMAMLIFAFTLFMRRLVDRSSFFSLGFQWKGYTNEAGLGAFAALAMLGIGTLVLVATGFLSFITAIFDPLPLLLQLAVMMVVAFTEELMFRGYLLNNLLQSTNKWIALGITAVLFSIFHGANAAITAVAFVNILLAGLLMGINYIYTKNLWFGIFFHFTWNFFQGPLLGYEVSGLELAGLFQQSLIGPGLVTGGPFGFEGSIVCALLLLIALLVFGYAFSRRYEVAPINAGISL